MAWNVSRTHLVGNVSTPTPIESLLRRLEISTEHLNKLKTWELLRSFKRRNSNPSQLGSQTSGTVPFCSHQNSWYRMA